MRLFRLFVLMVLFVNLPLAAHGIVGEGYIARAIVWIIFGFSFAVCAFKADIFDHRLLIKIQPYYLLPALVPIASFQQNDIITTVLWLFILFCTSVITVCELRNQQLKLARLEAYLVIIAGGIVGLAIYGAIVPWSQHVMYLPVVVVALSICFQALGGIEINIKLLYDVIYAVLLLILLLALKYLKLPIEVAHALLYCFVATTMSFIARQLPLRYILCLCAIIVAGSANLVLPYHMQCYIFCAILMSMLTRNSVVYIVKSPYTTLKITQNISSNLTVLYSGKTVHGLQEHSIKPNSDPRSYYLYNSPIGKMLQSTTAKKIAVIGLGAGSLAAYGQDGQEITFFEIDEEVIKIAKNTDYFTYLQDSKAKITVVQGDARNTLLDQLDASFDLLICDAYIGQNPVMSLITYEAMQLYMQKLSPDGVMLFNLSGQQTNAVPKFISVLNNLGLHGFDNNYDPGADREAGAKKTLGLVLPGTYHHKNSRDSITKFYRMLQAIAHWVSLFLSVPDTRFTTYWIAVAKDEQTLLNIHRNSNWQKIEPSKQDGEQLLTDGAIGFNQFRI